MHCSANDTCHDSAGRILFCTGMKTWNASCTTVIYAVKLQFSISLRDIFDGDHMVVWCTTIYGISVDQNLKEMRCCNTLLLMSYRTLLEVTKNSWSPSENAACKIVLTPFALLLLRHTRKTLWLVGLF